MDIESKKNRVLENPKYRIIKKGPWEYVIEERLSYSDEWYFRDVHSTFFGARWHIRQMLKKDRRRPKIVYIVNKEGESIRAH